MLHHQVRTLMSTVSMRSLFKNLMIVGVAAILAGCSSGKFKDAHSGPKLSAIEDPTTSPGYRPVNLPLPEPEPAVYSANSLWRSNDQSFFRDGRATKVGDILTVNVTIDDEAQIENNTETSRSAGFGLGVGTGVLGSIFSLIPGVTDASAVANANLTSNTAGDGSVDRSEELTTNVAAIIVQRLPNGNLVIEGRQEVRVNSELRELVVAGIIRPDDIQPDNTIASNKIAQARISYGGRGNISNAQTPNLGFRLLDTLSPI